MNNEVIVDSDNQATQVQKKVWSTPELEKIEFLETLAGGTPLRPDGMYTATSL